MLLFPYRSMTNCNLGINIGRTQELKVLKLSHSTTSIRILFISPQMAFIRPRSGHKSGRGREEGIWIVKQRHDVSLVDADPIMMRKHHLFQTQRYLDFD